VPPNGFSDEILAKVKVFPIPSKNLLTASLPESLTIQAIKFIDSRGRAVNIKYSILGHTAEIETKHLPSGVYYVQIETSEGNISRKLIVQ
jgi:hypothetical protein